MYVDVATTFNIGTDIMPVVHAAIGLPTKPAKIAVRRRRACQRYIPKICLLVPLDMSRYKHDEYRWV